MDLVTHPRTRTGIGQAGEVQDAMFLRHLLQIDLRELAHVPVHPGGLQGIVREGLAATVNGAEPRAAGGDDRHQDTHRTLVKFAVARTPDREVVIGIGARPVFGATGILGDLLGPGATPTELLEGDTVARQSITHLGMEGNHRRLGGVAHQATETDARTVGNRAGKGLRILG